MKSFFFLLLFMSFSVSAKSKMDQLELQEDIQRFFSRFTERVVQAFIDPKFVKAVNKRGLLINQYLLYESEALKITTGPFPELNLLDMLIFVKINKVVLRDYWIPKRFKGNGKDIWAAFKKSEQDLENVAQKILTQKELKQIDEAVVQWFKNNPGQYRVEKVRLGDFSNFASSISRNQGSDWWRISVSNLLVDTKSTVKAVDQMVLVANRAIFLAQHIPSLMRLQARLATLQIIDDVSASVQESNKIPKTAKAIKPLMSDASGLLQQMNELMINAKGFSHSMNKTVPKGINFSDDIKEVHDTVSTLNSMLTEVNDNRPQRQALIQDLKEELRKSIWFIAMIVILVAFCFSLFWWGGAYLVKRRLQKTAEKL